MKVTWSVPDDARRQAAHRRGEDAALRPGMTPCELRAIVDADPDFDASTTHFGTMLGPPVYVPAHSAIHTPPMGRPFQRYERERWVCLVADALSGEIHEMDPRRLTIARANGA